MSVFDKGATAILACSAIVSSLPAIPLILRTVPPNPVQGYRARATLSGDTVWHEARAYLGLRCLAAGLVSACMAVALHAWGGVLPATYPMFTIGSIAAPVVVAARLTARFVRGMRVESRSSCGPGRAKSLVAIPASAGNRTPGRWDAGFEKIRSPHAVDRDRALAFSSVFR